MCISTIANNKNYTTKYKHDDDDNNKNVCEFYEIPKSDKPWLHTPKPVVTGIRVKINFVRLCD